MEVVKEFVVKGYVDANFDTNPVYYSESSGLVSKFAST